MVVRARLTAPQPVQAEWPWHEPNAASLPISLLAHHDRRMEAESYLTSGFGIRISIESQKCGWVPLKTLARVWQPSRLKGTLVGPEFGTPYLSATQVFDQRPMPRKWLALEKIKDRSALSLARSDIIVTRSGSVGRATLAFSPHLDAIISDDLLRVVPVDQEWWGWIYAYLRSSHARQMMISAHYGHIIKHLEVSHLNAVPLPLVSPDLRRSFNDRVQKILEHRERAHALSLKAEDLFESALDVPPKLDEGEGGSEVHARVISHRRRRLEATYHVPIVNAILDLFKRQGLNVVALQEVCDRIWWMTRFKRVFGQEGVPYLSADELFSVNPSMDKRVMIEQADKPEEFFAKAGWLVMACSGQVYGVNGSVAFITEAHEGCFLTHDLVRIIPRTDAIQPGYLLIALSHPLLGRPLVVRNAYGSSIPHLEPADVSCIPIVRLERSVEDHIAGIVEEAMVLRTRADTLENEVAAEADQIISRFMAGETSDSNLEPLDTGSQVS